MPSWLLGAWGWAPAEGGFAAGAGFVPSPTPSYSESQGGPYR
jgi:hypothetical protein